MKKSSLLKVFDGNKLIHLEDGAQNADCLPLTSFEKEILRIFKEHKEQAGGIRDSFCLGYAYGMRNGYEGTYQKTVMSDDEIRGTWLLAKMLYETLRKLEGKKAKELK